METFPEINTVSLPTLDDIFNQHDLDHKLFTYYLFHLRVENYAIYEFTLRCNAGNNDSTTSSSVIETQANDPSPSFFKSAYKWAEQVGRSAGRPTGRRADGVLLFHKE